MTINARLRELRKSLSINQSDFAKSINLKQGAVSKMEQEGNTVTEQNIKAICDAFKVSADWLRTGAGEMFAPKEILGVLEMLQNEMELSTSEIDAIRAFVAMPQERRQAGIRFIMDFAHELENLPPMAPPAPPMDQPQANADGTYTVTVCSEDLKALEELKKREKLATLATTSAAADGQLA